jgi:hypothetical protein
MSDDRDTILREQQRLETMRLPEERIWKSIAEMIRPEDQDFQGQLSSANAMDEIFDSTPLYALEDFTGGLFGQLTNPANDWFGLGVPDEELMLYQPVKQWLWLAKSRIRATLGASISSFYTEVPSWFADLGAFGLGVLYSEEDIGRGQIIDRAIPLREVYVDADYAGRINRVHRKFQLSGRQVLQKFPDTANVREKDSYEIVHAVFLNADFHPGRLGPEGKAYASHYVCQTLADLHRVSGYEEMPYFVPTWSRRSGKVYPRGPGHVARPDMRSLQVMERLHLTAAEFAADPMTLINAESDLTLSDFYPGALLQGGMNDQGKALAQTLQRGQQLQLSMQQSEQRRAAVREAFYFSIMQLVNRPQMTATEFNGFQEEKLRQLAPNLERVQQGGLTPLIMRRFRILERAGQLPPPPPELEDQMLTIDYLSPLAKVQKMAEGRATWALANQIMQLAQFKPDVADNLDFDQTVAVLHSSGSAPPIVLADPATIEATRAQRAQQAAASQQLDAAKQQAEIAATAGHAAQAASLAKGRPQ